MGDEANPIGDFYIEASRGKPNGEVFHSLICIFKLLEKRTSEALKPFGLSVIKFNTLILAKYLANGNGIIQNDISHHLVISPSNITRLLDSLEQEEYITRTTSAGDRRANLIQITQRGSDIVDRAWEDYCQTIRDTVTILNEDDVKSLASLLNRWYTGLEDIGELGKHRVFSQSKVSAA